MYKNVNMIMENIVIYLIIINEMKYSKKLGPLKKSKYQTLIFSLVIHILDILLSLSLLEFPLGSFII